MKINTKYLPFIVAIGMALSMGLVMSFTITLINIGFTSYFFSAWARAFGIGALVGMPTAILVSPFVQSVAKKIVSAN
jgi:hypothetical protein